LPERCSKDALDPVPHHRIAEFLSHRNAQPRNRKSIRAETNDHVRRLDGLLRRIHTLKVAGIVQTLAIGQSLAPATTRTRRHLTTSKR